ncbi:hypothetical protein QBC39DRAFT_420549 [Podospora conica]|nr:hypothetical protein QBC39DRAFT_420549 [Schizothecium conicum]
MDQPKDEAPKGHTRTRSAVKATRPRSSTKGPLDLDDPGLPTPTLSLTHLLSPTLYPPPPAPPLPPSFSLRPPPPTTTPLPTLLTSGLFRLAALSAAHALTGPTRPHPSDHTTIFRLLYTRLACLALVDPTLAAAEARALDLDAALAADLVPWGLRVLLVRLQALGDGRRAVMGYYELAREARGKGWTGRLGDVGVRVAGAMVEMGDWEGAAGVLAGVGGDTEGVEVMRGLVWLQMGDVEAARRGAGEGRGGEVVRALCEMAEGGYEKAVGMWEGLRGGEGGEMVGVNMAVCLLYVGRMQEGKALLEELVASGKSSPTLLFNLSTMYELCTERATALKLELSETVAAMDGSLGGWERSNADFKL